MRLRIIYIPPSPRSSPAASSAEAYAEFLARDRLGFRDNAGPRPGLAVESVLVDFASQQAKRQPAAALRLPHDTTIQRRVPVESPAKSTIVRAALAESHVGAVAAAARADTAAPAEAAIVEGSNAGQGKRDPSGASVR